MHLIEATAAPVFELPGIAFTALASPSRGSAELCTWKLTVEAGLPPTQPHSLDRDEIFMMTAGAVLIGVEGTLVRAGDAIVVPAGTGIQLANPGSVDAEIYVAIRADSPPPRLTAPSSAPRRRQPDHEVGQAFGPTLRGATLAPTLRGRRIQDGTAVIVLTTSGPTDIALYATPSVEERCLTRPAAGGPQRHQVSGKQF